MTLNILYWILGLMPVYYLCHIEHCFVTSFVLNFLIYEKGQISYFSVFVRIKYGYVWKATNIALVVEAVGKDFCYDFILTSRNILTDC